MNEIENCEANPLSLISPLLEIGYCSITLSIHDIIRLIWFVSKIEVGIIEWVLSLIYIQYFISARRLMWRVVAEILGT
jgi:hypothetical protein